MVTDRKALSAPRAYSNQTETPGEKIDNTFKKALEAASNDVAATPTVRPSPQSFAKATEEPVRTTHDVALHGGEKLNQIAQVPHVVAFGYPSIVFKLVEYTQQTVQRNVTVLSQMLQARTFNDRLELQAQYVRDSVTAFQKTNAQIAQVSTDAANEARQVLRRRSI